MILRQPNWAHGLLGTELPGHQGQHEQQQKVEKHQQSAVTELVMALSDQRVYREVVWALKRGLRDARSEFSFVRVRGLNALAKFVASATNSEKVIERFRDTQSSGSCKDLADVVLRKRVGHAIYPRVVSRSEFACLVPVLFGYTLARRKRLAKNLSIRASAEAGSSVESSPSSTEVALALRVLEGCCLLYSGCRVHASQHASVSELIDLFLAGGPSVQSPCLDGLLAVMLESPSNQKEFERVHGLRKIAEMLRNSHLDPGIRLRIAEFIVILISQILPSSNEGCGVGEGPKPAWMTKWAQQELVELLGQESSAVVDYIMDAGRLTEFSNQQDQHTSMLLYAQELLRLAC